jgi:hypothetical protein
MVSALPRSTRAALAAFALLFIALALALMPAASRAASITLSSDAEEPGIAVDADGTGHIGFQTHRMVGADRVEAIGYCRLPRGATSCAQQVTFPLPSALYATFGKVQVLLSGDSVIVVAYAGGNSNEGVYAWTSANKGVSFTAATVPKRVAGDLAPTEAILGPGSGSVSLVNSTVGGGVEWATGALAGSTEPGWKIGENVLPDGTDADFTSGAGLLNATTPYAIMSTGRSVFLRTLNPTSGTNPNVPANWNAAVRVDVGDAENVPDPRTAYGPSGAFVTYETNVYANGGYYLDMRRIYDDGSLGPLQQITADGVSPIQTDLSQDGSGRLHLAYQDNRKDNRLYYQWSKRGLTFSDPIPLSDPGENAGVDTQVGVGPDGAGWVVAGSGANSSGIEPLKAYVLDPKGDADPSPTPKPGATTPPPPVTPPPACPAQIAVATGVKAMVRTGACFKDLGKGKFSTTGSVRVNGVDFTAPQSGTFTVDTKAHTVTAKGQYQTTAGSIVLAKGNVTWDVTQVNTIDGLSAFGVKLFGFGVSGKADVTFSPAGAAITINVDMPYPINSVRGQTTLRTTMTDGLIVDGVHITASTVPIGPLELRNLDILYTGANDALEGHADVYLPPAAKSAISAGFGVADGQFKHAEFEVGPGVPPLPLPLWAAPPILLNRVGMSASVVDGFKLAGGAEIVAGASIAGMAPLSINALPSSGGGVSLYVPKSGAYAEIAASGKLAILDIPVSTGHLSIRTDGPLTFGGSTDLDFELITMHVGVDGGINLSNGDFYAAGDASACASLIDVTGCAKVKAILSSIGIAACGSLEGKENLSGLSVSIGLGYDRKWGGSSHVGDCHFDQYKPASLGGSGARAHQLAVRAATGGHATLLQTGAAQTLVLPGGEQRGVLVHGAGSRPGFTFSGPGGRTITVPAGTKGPIVGGNVAAVAVSADTIELQVHQPAGSWTLTPADGSTVASLETAAMLPTPKLSAKVKRGQGRARTVTVRASNLGPQTLIVRELLAGGAAHELGTVKTNGATTLRFTPADGAGGKRSIEAVVVANGRQVAATPIGSYVAPPMAKLAAPRAVTLKRSKTGVSVKWKKVAGADHYRVAVTATDGRKQVLSVPGKSTKVSVPGVTTDDQVVITVSAVTKLGAEGKGRKATSKPVKTAKRKKKATKKAS